MVAVYVKSRNIKMESVGQYKILLKTTFDSFMYFQEEKEMDRSNYCTLHGIERTMERTGLSEKRAVKLVRLALERGIHAEDCKWTADRRYLQSLCSEQAEAIAYNSYCLLYTSPSPRDRG